MSEGHILGNGRQKNKRKRKDETFFMRVKVDVRISKRLVCVGISTHTNRADLKVGSGKMLEDLTLINIIIKPKNAKGRALCLRRRSALLG